MARYEAIGEPVNDSERVVLLALRDGLPDDWFVLGNFEIFDGRRTFEADAVVISPHGWTYVVEVKQMDVIEGNDSTWMVRGWQGSNLIPRPSPYGITNGKAKKLKGVIKQGAPAANTFTAPLITIMSRTDPTLHGAVAAVTCRHTEIVDRVQVDPRSQPTKVDPHDAVLIFETLMRDARPLTPPDQLGGFKLIERIGVGPSWSTWQALSVLSPEQPLRLKYYTIDPLLDGPTHDQILKRACADSRTLYRLSGTPGIVPIVSLPQVVEGGLVVATTWPQGQTLASHIERGLSSERAERILENLMTVMANLHAKGVIHRNLTPMSVYVTANDSVEITDFDFARVVGESGITAMVDPEDLDIEYVAPEVLADPAHTTTASDVWSLGTIGRAMYPDSAPIPSALEASLEAATQPDPAQRPQDAGELLDMVTAQAFPSSVYRLQAQDVINARYVVEGTIAEGGHSLVFKAFDTLIESRVALKFAKPESSIDLTQELQVTDGLPKTKGLSTPTYLDQASSLRRSAQTGEFAAQFLVLPWIDGELLSAYLRPERRLTVADGLRVVRAIATSVCVLHEAGVVHRDLKPDNVLVDRQGNPWVIDFNTSTSPSYALNWSLGGTPWYQPADVAIDGLAPDVDVYALGGVLLELLVGERLAGNFAGRLDTETDLPQPVIDLVTNAIANRPHRPADCCQFVEAIDRTIDHIAAGGHQTKIDAIPTPPSDPNTNPTVSSLVKRISQSSLSNSYTRAAPQPDSEAEGTAEHHFDHLTYVQTRLDSDLSDDFTANHQSRLVIITGNAGDGKTTFIRHVEDNLAASHNATVEPLVNGARITATDLDFLSNWDGSQDEAGLQNDDVLAAFLSPFSGQGPTNGGAIRLIGVNEGRLLDFVRSHRPDFPALAELVEAGLIHDRSVEQPWLVMVNLNMRTLTAPAGGATSIVEKTISAFTRPELWAVCDSCDFKEQCPIRSNAAALDSADLGPRIGQRLRGTLDVVRLRRQMHVTMRDLRSLLAFVITGNTTCVEIADHIAHDRNGSLLNLSYYNNLFAASAFDTGHPSRPSAQQDRYLRSMAELDVARFSTPIRDAFLWHGGTGSHSDVADPGAAILGKLMSTRRYEGDGPDGRRETQLIHASLRRRELFESDGFDWSALLPFNHLNEFSNLLSQDQEIDAAQLLDAISRSDEFPVERFPNSIGVNTGAGTLARADTFIAHPKSSFKLMVNDQGSLAKYTEYSPSTLLLVLEEHPDIKLVIDLELFEMLTQVANGNSISLEQRQGNWIELAVFKDRLRRLAADQTILVDDTGRVFSIRRREDMIGIEVERVGR